MIICRKPVGAAELIICGTAPLQRLLQASLADQHCFCSRGCSSAMEGSPSTHHSHLLHHVGPIHFSPQQPFHICSTGICMHRSDDV